MFRSDRFTAIVTLGLDPRVHPFRKKMDCRVPQTSLRSLRNLDCFCPAMTPNWIDLSGIRFSVVLDLKFLYEIASIIIVTSPHKRRGYRPLPASIGVEQRDDH
jgi:hypothetical protein